jgi:hypothetical protein
MSDVTSMAYNKKSVFVSIFMHDQHNNVKYGSIFCCNKSDISYTWQNKHFWSPPTTV